VGDPESGEVPDEVLRVALPEEEDGLTEALDPGPVDQAPVPVALVAAADASVRRGLRMTSRQT